MNQDNEAIPIGTWLRIQLPGMPTLIVYTYLDPQAGLSAKGGAQDDVNLAEAPSRTVRLPMPGSVWEALSEEEVRQRNLPQPPSWVDRFYGPQAELETPSGEWRHHPRLRGRFHPEFPDDLQVIVHDGGPRLSPNPAELVWVRVVHQEGELFRGEVLNQPHKLKSVRHGDEVLFIVPASGEHPLQVR
ncbi:MAG: DUF2314 domain-containing protein, partial [Planctomycetaceae bacterium]|nr:DUF2314 domain-containing protein [Planctomycetaceae bacterium]